MNTTVKSNRQWQLDCEALTKQCLEQAKTIEKQDERITHLLLIIERLKACQEQYESECG